MRINKEGYKIIGISGAVCLLLWWLFYHLLVHDANVSLLWFSTLVLLLFWFFIVAFFREPRRVRIHDADLVFAPCDGRVVVTEVVSEDEYLKEEMLQISIFMSITNVHMNWVPVGGEVEYFKYHPGRFLVAWHPKSSTENERTTTVVRMPSGQKVLFRQIAGLIARRIISYMTVGHQVEQNSVCGFIKFGSRVDVLVPKDSELLVEIGDPTVGSQTPIARMQHDLQALFSLPESTFSLSDELTAALRQIIDINSLNTIFSSVINLVLSSVIAIFSVSFITFFFLKEEGLFYAMVTSVFPEHYHGNITRALDSVTVLLARYFTGILSESLLLTIAVTLVMMAFGMKAADAGFIGLIMGVMNVVPYAGPLIGGVVSVFVGIVSPIEGMSVGHTAFVIAGSLLILKGMDDFILQPTLYSERVKAHPLEIFLVILIAGSLAGILGMLLAIPSYTVLRVFAKEFFSQFRLVRKLTEKI